ncbi:MAG: HAD family hydrolase [Vicinamibacterales bacterium]
MIASGGDPPPGVAGRPRLIAFDLDGTLLDSRRDLADAANDTLALSGYSPLAVEAITRMVGEGAGVLLERAFAASGAAVPDGALATFLQFYDSRIAVHTRPYDGVPESLERLASWTTLAVVTNKPLKPTLGLLEHFGLAQYFVRVVGGDGPWPRKPDPAGLLALLAEMDVRPDEALFVGDSWVDLETARRAGVTPCLVRYGFGFDQIPPGMLNGRERIVNQAKDLAGL